MNARARDPRVQRLLDIVQLPGVAGMRYTAGQLAAVVGVSTGEVTDWIRRGILRASRYEDEHGVRYAIKRSAVRRAFRDHPKLLSIVLSMPAGSSAEK
jgi:hypothetical protein